MRSAPAPLPIFAVLTSSISLNFLNGFSNRTWSILEAVEDKSKFIVFENRRRFINFSLFLGIIPWFEGVKIFVRCYGIYISTLPSLFIKI